MTGFLGRYEHQLDDKGRVSLPSAFRREAEGDRFVLLQWEKPYLTLFTADHWQTVQKRLIDFRRSRPDAWHQVRAVASRAVEVVPDKQGRILIPAWFKEAAGLVDAVLMNGNVDRVEIWSPDTFRATVDEAAASDEMDAFKHDLFG